MAFYAYLLECRDASYYTGHTDDLDARLIAHQQGIFRGYTLSRRPVKLVWSQDFPTRDEAFQAERQIKGWSRAKKQALIAGDWDRLVALAAVRGGSSS
jgi:putative endonuclease